MDIPTVLPTLRDIWLAWRCEWEGGESAALPSWQWSERGCRGGGVALEWSPLSTSGHLKPLTLSVPASRQSSVVRLLIRNRRVVKWADPIETWPLPFYFLCYVAHEHHPLTHTGGGSPGERTTATCTADRRRRDQAYVQVSRSVSTLHSILNMYYTCDNTVNKYLKCRKKIGRATYENLLLLTLIVSIILTWNKIFQQ